MAPSSSSGKLNPLLLIVLVVVIVVFLAWIFTRGTTSDEVVSVPDITNNQQGTTNRSTDTDSEANTTEVQFSFANLAPLAQGHYEGWLIFHSSPNSTGKFTVGEDGTLLDLTGTPIAEGTFTVDIPATGPIQALVSIEPEGDANDIPGVILLAGFFGDDLATLSFDSILDLSTASGQYILGTPTDGSNSTDEAAGMWFTTPDGQNPTLQLLDLETDSSWVYEGWVVTAAGPLTTGRFRSPTGRDVFKGYSGDAAPGPAFPGEDYLNNAPDGFTFPLNLADGSTQVVISVEPDVNGVDPTGDGPFQLKPLSATIPAGLTDHTLADLTLDLTGFPTGTVSVQ